MTNRIFITGIAGSGKTSLAHAISDITDIQVLSLDTLTQASDWEVRDSDTVSQELSDWLDSDNWIIEGLSLSHTATLAEQADIIVIAAPPSLECVYRVAKRFVSHYGSERDGLNVSRKIDSHILKGVMNYIREGSPLSGRALHNILAAEGHDSKVVIITNEIETEALLELLKNAQASEKELSEIDISPSPGPDTLLEAGRAPEIQKGSYQTLN